jgi:hypothetical protein
VARKKTKMLLNIEKIYMAKTILVAKVADIFAKK